VRDETIRVLLIEDDLGDALLVTRRLERELGSLENIRLDRALTLAEGIDRLGKESTDAVLLDLHLPDSAGADTVRRLREADPNVPIVVFTSAGDGDLPLRALKAGAQDYLGKGDFETGPLIHRCLRYAIERARIVGEKQRLQEQLDEAERMQSLGVLGAGAAFGFTQLIGTILDHVDEALTDLGDAPLPASRACTCSRRASRRCARSISPSSCATTREPIARRCARSTCPASSRTSGRSSRRSQVPRSSSRTSSRRPAPPCLRTRSSYASSCSIS
jgi:response regulator of citrate/malate metabolism